MRRDLTNWSFREGGTYHWYKAKVPGCNFLDLLENELIEDPFYKTNEKNLAWVGASDWEYISFFNLKKQDLKKTIYINFDCIDTVCDIYLNKQLLAKVANAHVAYSYDISTYVKEGKNTLVAYFYSPVKYVKKKQAAEEAPPNGNGQDGVVHIRKPQYHFGWDWGPVLVPTGLSGRVWLDFYENVKIEELSIEQYHMGESVKLQVDVKARMFSENVPDIEVRLFGPSGVPIISKLINYEIEEGLINASTEIELDNPILWWTRELSGKDKQALYKVMLIMGEEIIEKSIGIRTIVLNRSFDEYGQNFQFLLNGVPIFAKGANWIPPDSFINRVTTEDLEKQIDAALDANFNMLRIWGGGYYGSDEMYDICDRKGILIWQDFAFACQGYPFFDIDFLNNVKYEVVSVVKRLKHHASLALWCGNNEVEALSIMWKHKRKYIKSGKTFFYETLPKLIGKIDGDTSYIPGSPVGVGYNRGVNHDNVGDTHLWAVWHGLQPTSYYRKRYTRFCSEFGFESMPNIKTIKSFAEPKDYSLDSEVFLSHQKCTDGNLKMKYYILSRFNLPTTFEDYIYLSNACQLDCVQNAAEHWRRNKGRCNGALYWQFNDCWPVVSWSGMDYYGNYKALHYGAKHFFAPIMLSIEDHKKHLEIYAHNDTLNKFKGEIELKLYSFDGEEAWSNYDNLEIAENTVRRVASVKHSDFKSVKRLDKYVFVARLLKEGKLVSKKTLLFDSEKNLILPKPNITINARVNGNEAEYILTSDKYARLVCLNSKENINPFSDNYFDLIPFQQRIITQKIDKKYTVRELNMTTEVTSVAALDLKSKPIKALGTRLSIFFKPINLFAWLYFKKVPRPFKVKKKDKNKDS